MSDEPFNPPRPVEPEPKPPEPADPKITAGALYILRNSGGDLRMDMKQVQRAAEEIATYHAPDSASIARHQRLRDAATEFLLTLVADVPAGAERSTAISRCREALFWGNAGVALRGR
jgi:hypothetical protein